MAQAMMREEEGAGASSAKQARFDDDHELLDSIMRSSSSPTSDKLDHIEETLTDIHDMLVKKPKKVTMVQLNVKLDRILRTLEAHGFNIAK